MLSVINIRATNEVCTAVNILLEELNDRIMLSEEDIFAVKLVAHELVNNSVRHAKTRASLMYKLQDSTLLMAVLDAGEGFCHSEKCGCSDIYSENGRGIFLARQYSECLRYNKKGNAVVVRVRIGR